MVNIGENIKRIRKTKNITLKDIATNTNLSVAYLSKVERNINVPTILNLQKICTALGISINDIFVSPQSKIHFPKNEQHTLLEYSDVSYKLATSPDIPLKGSIMTIHPKGEIKTFKHTFDELGFILSGSIEVIVNDISYQVQQGDTIFIPYGSDHTVKNHESHDCVSYWVKGYRNNQDMVLNENRGFLEDKN